MSVLAIFALLSWLLAGVLAVAIVIANLSNQSNPVPVTNMSAKANIVLTLLLAWMRE